MLTAIDTIRNDPDGLAAWFDRLAPIFRNMDEAYTREAERCGFVCRGCVDNCCKTRFHHHTLLEYLAVNRGFQLLTARERAGVREKATANVMAYAQADAAGTPVRLWCPLNREGRCVVYALRPMICRMHGIPHELHHPGGNIVKGPGCGDFDIQTKCEGVHPLDRTPFYREMAALEKAFRQSLGFSGKFKLTIAEMIGTF